MVTTASSMGSPVSASVTVPVTVPEVGPGIAMAGTRAKSIIAMAAIATRAGADRLDILRDFRGREDKESRGGLWPMKYRLVYTNRAVKDIRRLDERTRERIGKSLEGYIEEPLKYASKLTDPALGTYRFRIGDYRVIFDIQQEEIVVLRVGHRRDIYRRL